MPESILYYPTINIQDSTWLRNAALYWDEVCSIVPYRGYADISPELKYMEQRGQYRSIYPQELFYSHNADELCAMIRNSLTRISTNKKHCNLERLHINKLPREKSKRVFYPDLVELLHYKKLPGNLAETLVASGIVTPIDDEWLEVNSAFEHTYMRLLAKFAAKHDDTNMVIGTDKVRELDKVFTRFPDHTARTSSNTIVLTLDKCFPVPADDIGFERILDFKDEYQTELLELRRKIREYEMALSHCTSTEEAKRTTAAFRESWEIKLINAEKMLRGRGIGCALKSMRTFIVDAGAAAGLIQLAQSNGLLPSNPAILGATVGMSGLIGVGVQHRNYRNRIYDRIRETGFAYLIKANQEGLIRGRQVGALL